MATVASIPPLLSQEDGIVVGALGGSAAANVLPQWRGISFIAAE